MKVSKVLVTRVALCAIAALIIAPSAFAQSQTNWGGTISSDWNNPANWTAGVPTSSSNVIISLQNFAPVVPPAGSDTAAVGDLTVQSGGELSFANGGVLVIAGTQKLQNDGVITLGNGKMIFKNNISFLNGGTFEADSGSLSFQGVTWENKSGSTFNPGTSSVVFEGTSSQTMTGTVSFYNVEFANALGTVSLTGDVTITNSMNVDSGSSITLTSGSLTLSTSATLNIADGSTLTINGAFNNNGTVTGTLSSNKPLVQSVTTLNPTSIDLTFNEPVGAISSQDTSNYSIDKTINVTSAVRDSSNHAIVHLAVTTLYQDTVYTMTINNIIDETASDTIAANTQRQFTYPPESLPVQLSSFSANASRLAAELFWSTESELNNYGFEIERRSIQRLEGWLKAAFVAGAGTSSSSRDYRYIDANLPPGRYAYRIKQIDNDGTFQYYGNAEVEIGVAAREFKLESNYPNPFNPSTKIEFTLGTDGHASLRVYNMLGQEVATLFDELAQAGKLQQVRFDASRLPSGMYFAKLEAGRQQMMRKMLLVK